MSGRPLPELCGIINTHRAKFCEMDAGWWADVLVCEAGLGVADRTLKQACQAWQAGVAKLIAELAAAAARPDCSRDETSGAAVAATTSGGRGGAASAGAATQRCWRGASEADAAATSVAGADGCDFRLDVRAPRHQ